MRKTTTDDLTSLTLDAVGCELNVRLKMLWALFLLWFIVFLTLSHTHRAGKASNRALTIPQLG